MAEYTLPPLPYDHGALEPHIDARTMEIHHGKHHAAYVNNLNAALKEHPEHQGKTLEALISNLNALPEQATPAGQRGGRRQRIASDQAHRRTSLPMTMAFARPAQKSPRNVWK